MSPIAAELTIGELSERSGVPASALRFYECALVNPDDKLAERGPGAHLLNPG